MRAPTIQGRLLFLSRSSILFERGYYSGGAASIRINTVYVNYNYEKGGVAGITRQ